MFARDNDGWSEFYLNMPDRQIPGSSSHKRPTRAQMRMRIYPTYMPHAQQLTQHSNRRKYWCPTCLSHNWTTMPMCPTPSPRRKNCLKCWSVFHRIRSSTTNKIRRYLGRRSLRRTTPPSPLELPTINTRCLVLTLNEWDSKFCDIFNNEEKRCGSGLSENEVMTSTLSIYQ